MGVVVIIPAYNEEKTVSQVVTAALACELVEEVVVVSDGSTDRTVEEATAAGARVISLPENMGKGAAMHAGIKATGQDVILFLDGDLLGITPVHVRRIIEPVLEDRADMTVGVFGDGRFCTDIAQKIAPHLSGQRALRRSVITCAPDIGSSRFGVETLLSKYAEEMGLRVTSVILDDVSHRMKEEKQGFVKGVCARFLMYRDILRSAKRSRL